MPAAVLLLARPAGLSYTRTSLRGAVLTQHAAVGTAAPGAENAPS